MNNSDNQRLVLASGSPRRRELLTQIGVAYTVQSANIDESLLPYEKPDEYVARLANAKATMVAGMTLEGQTVLGADTTVVVGDEVLGKPTDAEDASTMLAKLSGRQHQVLTAVALVRSLSKKLISAQTVTTTVVFRQLSPAEIDVYVRSGEPMDKAGAYAIQGLGGAFVKSIHGSYTNVVGLPLAETYELLAAAKLRTGLSG